MHGTYLIEIAHKPGIKDPLAAGMMDDLKHLGARGVKKVTTSKLYRLIGQMTEAEHTRVGEELLSDPVVEEVCEGGWVAKPLKTPKADKKGAAPESIVVDVWFKQGVTDAVGESVLKGLRDLNLEEIQDVRTGMRYRFNGLKDTKAAERFALALVINPLIHDRFIHAD